MISSLIGSNACLALPVLAVFFERLAVVVFLVVLFLFVDEVVRFVLPDVFFPEEPVLFFADEEELFPDPFPLLRVVLEAI